MRRITILATAILLSVTAGAQTRHRFSAAPWMGEVIYGLQAGTFFQPSVKNSHPDLRHRLPLSLSLYFCGEEFLNAHFVYGIQAELNYTRCHDVVSVPLNHANVQDNMGRGDIIDWGTCGDVRIMVGYYFTEAFALTLSGGLYEDLLSGSRSTLTYTLQDSGEEITKPMGESKPSFGWNIGYSGTLDAHYYFTDEFFASLTAKVHTPFGIKLISEGRTLKTNYALMIGIGYKIN